MSSLRDPLDLVKYYKDLPWQQDAIRLWWEFTDPAVQEEILRLYRNVDGIPEPEPEPDAFDTVTKREIMDALKYIGSKVDQRMKREVLLNQLIQETELD